jgi:hypothetical protein
MIYRASLQVLIASLPISMASFSLSSHFTLLARLCLPTTWHLAQHECCQHCWCGILCWIMLVYSLLLNKCNDYIMKLFRCSLASLFVSSREHRIRDSCIHCTTISKLAIRGREMMQDTGYSSKHLILLFARAEVVRPAGTMFFSLISR